MDKQLDTNTQKAMVKRTATDPRITVEAPPEAAALAVQSLQRGQSAPRVLSPVDILALQRTVGNAAVNHLLQQHQSLPALSARRALASRGSLPDRPTGQSTAESMVEPAGQAAASPTCIVQRLTIPGGDLGLGADFDSTNLLASRQQIQQLADGNRKDKLLRIVFDLQNRGAKSGILEAKTNDEQLLALASELAENGPKTPEMQPMGFFERRAAAATAGDQPAVNEQWRRQINIWVIGDKQRGIVWGAIGNHLRGRMQDDDYAALGVQCFLLLSQNQQTLFNQTNVDDPAKRLGYIALARQAFDAACAELRGGLGHLPNFDSTSYRQAGLADGSVFNGKIAQGNLVMDKAFWSTSLLRGAGGAAGNWDSIGTLVKPIAYFIIQGTTGKYIAKYAQTEGEQEVLFRDRVVFSVDRIVNLKNCTFFVYLTEVPPPPLGTVIKDPYTGNAYP